MSDLLHPKDVIEAVGAAENNEINVGGGGDHRTDD
jgi:hypothetical protein